MINILAADDRATPGTMTSTDILFTYSQRNIVASEPDGLKTFVFGLKSTDIRCSCIGRDFQLPKTIFLDRIISDDIHVSTTNAFTFAVVNISILYVTWFDVNLFTITSITRAYPSFISTVSDPSPFDPASDLPHGQPFKVRWYSYGVCPTYRPHVVGRVQMHV